MSSIPSIISSSRSSFMSCNYIPYISFFISFRRKFFISIFCTFII
nr:MAG TPA: hypothetical protein [Caudoviricetes sp.]